jgi:hypothetical protein
VDPNVATKQQLQDFINKLDFSAEISTNVDYTNYGAKLQVAPPQNSFDVLQKLMPSPVSTAFPQASTTIP